MRLIMNANECELAIMTARKKVEAVNWLRLAAHKLRERTFFHGLPLASLTLSALIRQSTYERRFA
jgi:hypothetical protein